MGPESNDVRSGRLTKGGQPYLITTAPAALWRRQNTSHLPARGQKQDCPPATDGRRVPFSKFEMVATVSPDFPASTGIDQPSNRRAVLACSGEMLTLRRFSTLRLDHSRL
jgi:hypothetical protein